MSDSTGFFMAGVSTVLSSDVILFAAGVLADSSFAASDCVFDSGALRAELDVVSLDVIELSIGFGDGLGSGAL
jgi:hypothetical protein